MSDRYTNAAEGTHGTGIKHHKSMITVYVGYKAHKEILTDSGLITEICITTKFGDLICDDFIREIAVFLLALQ